MKGYNGVATLTLKEPQFVLHGLQPGPDNEDVRILRTDVDGIAIVNTYVPQGYSIISERYQFKLDWFRRLREIFETYFDPGSRRYGSADLNIAPEPIDVYHPDRRVNDVDFHIDAGNPSRRGFLGNMTFSENLTLIAFQYTYWDYYRRASKTTGAGESTIYSPPRRWRRCAAPRMWIWSRGN